MNKNIINYYRIKCTAKTHGDERKPNSFRNYKIRAMKLPYRPKSRKNESLRETRVLNFDLGRRD